MTTEELLNIELYRPAYPIGQEVYIPVRKGAAASRIIGYKVQVSETDNRLVGKVSNYRLEDLVSVRVGPKQSMVNQVREDLIYLDRLKAESASGFIEVDVDKETWRLAIGKRTVVNEDSPYHVKNCELSNYCENMEEARNILLCCKAKNGLLIHDYNLLNNLLEGYDFKDNPNNPLGKIITQLRIGNAFLIYEQEEWKK